MLWMRKQGQNGLVAPPKATIENIFTWTGLSPLYLLRNVNCRMCRSLSRVVGFSVCHENPDTAPKIMRFLYLLLR